MVAPDNMACVENVAYDPASSTLKTSSHAKVTCSDNIAYSTVKQTKEDSVRSKAISRTAVYDEVTLT